MKILGIDNGLSGGLVMIKNKKILWATIMPVIKIGKKREYDISKLKEYIEYWEPDYAILEKAQAYPKQGGVSNFTTGYGFGIMTCLLQDIVPFTIVGPRTWQKIMFEGLPKTDTKNMSYLICKRLWGNFDWRATPRCKKPHDGLTDAAMLAEYGRRVIKL